MSVTVSIIITAVSIPSTPSSLPAGTDPAFIPSIPSTLPAGTDPVTSSPKIADFGLSALVARAHQDLAEEEAASVAAATAAATLQLGPLTQVRTIGRNAPPSVCVCEATATVAASLQLGPLTQEDWKREGHDHVNV